MSKASHARKRFTFIACGVLIVLAVSCIVSLVSATPEDKPVVTAEQKTVETTTVTEGKAASVAYYPLAIKTADGAQLFEVELALTKDEMQKGLMWRTGLDANKGMLFVFPSRRQVSFWMRNTLIPLDMLFITDNGVINHIHSMAQPHDETPVPSKGGEVIAVLEIGGGQAAQKGIQIGDTIDSDLLLKGTTE